MTLAETLNRTRQLAGMPPLSEDQKMKLTEVKDVNIDDREFKILKNR